MNRRILIVEDEQLVAADLEAKLQRLGHTVVGIAASGVEAVRLAEQELPDLALMDIRLQGSMDGMETAKIIQARTSARIVFVSAFGQLARFNGGISPPQPCLTKPFSTAQLEAILSQPLG